MNLPLTNITVRNICQIRILKCLLFAKLKEIIEELDASIFENILSNNHQTDAASQTGYFPEEKGLECENQKNKKLEGSGIKMKELELAIEIKDLKNGDINRKVRF